ncbi:MAG: glutamate-cysteine ligase family protein [Acidimicrobiia bacterium]
MPAPQPRLSAATATEYIGDTCFAPGAEALTGVEVEWILHDRGDPQRHLSLDEVTAAAGDPGAYAGRLSFEPGGQVEISSRPHKAAAAAAAETAADMALLEARAAAGGLVLSDAGRDPWRPPRRVLHVARYAAMERYFRGGGSHRPDAGPTMMCTTASVQVNLALGADTAEMARRWRNAAVLGPVLAAAFANSPLGPDGPTGWKSSRLASWFAIDPTRTAPVAAVGDPAAAWAGYVLDARVMFVRRGDDDYVVVHEPLGFGDWIRDGHDLGYPTEDDLAYHLTTLFPPVRPRGWFELRMVDMPGRRWWPVPVLVADVLLDADEPLERVAAVGAGSCWDAAARHALGDPRLAAAAAICFDAALERLGGADADLVGEYADRFVCRGRTPADEALDAAVAIA